MSLGRNETVALRKDPYRNPEDTTYRKRVNCTDFNPKEGRPLVVFDPKDLEDLFKDFEHYGEPPEDLPGPVRPQN